ncbi:MAG: beta-ketoacyl-[acyl-carrier-protein] synthase II, partial [Betaproteobacteria bacterium]|nr:beta-ketoacyl-[acyl-carrier-protein] synthase II [Betaproteobacteria bacterium]
MTATLSPPLLLSRYTATTCLGRGLDATLAALEHQGNGLKPCDFESVDIPTWIGEVAGLDDVALPPALRKAYDCRNNRLALLGLQAEGMEEAARAAIGRYGRRRVGLFLGTSTAGILSTELAFRQRDPVTGALPADFPYRGAHNTYSVAAFLRDHLGLEGPASVVSTACSSSAKVFAQAARMMALGLIDAALVGGIDSLCLTTLYGFSSLQLTSPRPCRPYDANRDGISVGEGAAYALVERCPDSLDSNALLLLGSG